ncbi:unnamed protein product [Ceratitis capitata]|uniref:(Mediterranean fruit fly) hypothetical protein n=1 Tax=Ceratitis capitata TaxID=7213 RepID=A0A811UNZ7_CERCA|nr:unnamed protein product [Ceratitis capitata]
MMCVAWSSPNSSPYDATYKNILPRHPSLASLSRSLVWSSIAVCITIAATAAFAAIAAAAAATTCNLLQSNAQRRSVEQTSSVKKYQSAGNCLG